VTTDTIQKTSAMSQADNMLVASSDEAEADQKVSTILPPEEPVGEAPACGVLTTDPSPLQSALEGAMPLTVDATVDVQTSSVLTNAETPVASGEQPPTIERPVTGKLQETAPVKEIPAAEDSQIEQASTATTSGAGMTAIGVAEELPAGLPAAVSTEDTVDIEKSQVSISESNLTIAEGSSGSVSEAEASAFKEPSMRTVSEANIQAEKEPSSAPSEIAISATGKHLATVSEADISSVGEPLISPITGSLDVEVPVTASKADISTVDEPEATVPEVATSVVEETSLSSYAGNESVDVADQDKVLDFDEDKRNPQYIPKKGSFYQHDDRMMGDEEVPSSQEQEKDEEDKGGRKQKKLWHDEGAWGHDMYREEEQAPKTSEELVGIYGYDIRSEEMPPRARRRRRYGRGPNKYVRNWEDEDAYAGRPTQPRGGGGRRFRGGPHTGSPSFREEDFPDLNNRKPTSSDTAQDQARDRDREPARRGGGGGLRRGRGTPGWNRRSQENSQRQAENGDSSEESHRRSWPPLQSPGTREAPHGQGGGGRGGRYGKSGAPPEDQERDAKPASVAERLSSAPVEQKDGQWGCPGVRKEQANPSVPPKGSSSGGGEAACRPKRYSSLRQRPPTEVTVAEPYPCLPREAAVLGSGAACLGPLAPGPVLPPAQRPPVLSPGQPPPPPVVAAGQLPGPFLPPTGLVGFPAQYAPYSFPAQFTAPAAPPPPQTPQKTFYHGDITYYNTQSQQHKQRSTPPRRPKAAIPIVPPP
ncbi:unnamed protein product, partial [Ixodes hexagonus]